MLTPDQMDTLRDAIAATLDTFAPNGTIGVMCVVLPGAGSVVQYTSNLDPDGLRYAAHAMLRRADALDLNPDQTETIQ